MDKKIIERFIPDGRYIHYTISGSHLYGFPSKDSDIDIRGCHILKKKEFLGLKTPRLVIEKVEGEIDFVSFDLKKEISLLLQNNSNVMEHVFATPFVTKPLFLTLRKIAIDALSKEIYNPYWGLATYNWKKYLLTFNHSFRQAPVKKYLYIIRGLLAGIYALEMGVIQPNIKTLNRYFKYSIVDELVERKLKGLEKSYMSGCSEADELIEKLWKDMIIARENSSLPEKPSEEVVDYANNFLLNSR